MRYSRYFIYLFHNVFTPLHIMFSLVSVLNNSCSSKLSVKSGKNKATFKASMECPGVDCIGLSADNLKKVDVDGFLEDIVESLEDYGLSSDFKITTCAASAT